MAKFFVDRPIVAIILSIAFVLGGAIAGIQLPIAQFPEITPPQISVSSQYPGADSVAVEQSVATPIEQQVNGVERMIYMRSTNASDGTMTLSVAFEVGSDGNTDNILVQNRVAQANPFLPQDVRNAGFNVRKATSSPMMFISINSPSGAYDQRFLSNFATIRIVDQLLRVNGVAEVRNFGGSDYSMRIWVRPQDLARHQLTVSDVLNAIRAQNTINPAGQIGGEPSPPGTQMTITARAPGRLETPEQFGDVVVRAEPDGSLVRVKDVARVELGLLSYRVSGRADGRPAALLGIFQQPGSNALDVATAVKAQMKQLADAFPPGMEYAVTLDTTLAISEGIREIVLTLLAALGLVVLVTFIFLQGWRATLIPLLTVPVSLVGSFLLFPLLGFSINTLSLFGMVLAIGLVVDDAIVVVEAVTHHIEQGMEPRAATLKAMEEVSGPVVGIALILAAVFVPLAFVPGISGRLGQQFALTIAVSVIISAFNALSLSPALCAKLLRPRPRGGKRNLLQRFFDGFERGYERSADAWTRVAGSLVRKSVLTLVALAALGGGAYSIGRGLPRSFVPTEDVGYFLMDVTLPDGASLPRTREVLKRIEDICLAHPAVAHVNTAAGFSILAQASSSNVGLVFVALKPWSEREGENTDSTSVVREMNRKLAQLPDARAFALEPPGIPGLSASGGVDVMIQDQTGRLTPAELAVEVEKFVAAARKRPELANMNTSFRASVPQYAIEAARDVALKQGVPVQDLFLTLQAYLGGVYVNDFNRFGRQWRVFLQAESTERATEDAFQQFYVRSQSGQMVPLSGLTNVKPTTGPLFTVRFNGYRSAPVTGSAAPGYSSGQALDAIEAVAKESLPPGMGIAWNGVSYQEKSAGSAASTFALALVAVFLVLAGLYGSWSLPFSVLLGTPVAVLGAFVGLWARHFPLDIFTQVGLVMLVGLAAKNAILIVAFARDAEKEGLSEEKAALQGARLRLRPILMTSFAFILGCVPLWIATGAGAIARREMGTTVITGMLAATLLGAIATPALYVLVERTAKRGKRHPAPAEPARPAEGHP